MESNYSNMPAKFRLKDYILSLAIILAVLAIVITGAEIGSLTSAKADAAGEIVVETGEEVELPALAIRLSDEVREYGRINTYVFDVYNTETDESCKLTDGVLSISSIPTVINKFLAEHPYKTVSVGVLDGRIYIQQDTTMEITDGTLKINILSLNGSFTADDWFDMTEAVLNTTDVETDSVFSYNSDVGSKHYIYIYIDRSETEGQEAPEGSDTNQDTEDGLTATENTAEVNIA